MQPSLQQTRAQVAPLSPVDAASPPLSEPCGDQSLTLLQTRPARQADGIHLIIPAQGDR